MTATTVADQTGNSLKDEEFASPTHNQAARRRVRSPLSSQLFCWLSNLLEGV